MCMRLWAGCIKVCRSGRRRPKRGHARDLRSRPITSGSVYLNGREVHIRNTRDAINHGIAMVNEDRRTYSSSFLLLVNLHNTDCVFSFFFIAFPL